ncbi:MULTISPECIES: polysaccharide export protein EpsE [unclassified Duganella]|uniref:polysaccharide export protein EpsE n=1 Tax=unclassified Duganella TaxID=2636909 RepID=UPI000B7F4682
MKRFVLWMSMALLGMSWSVAQAQDLTLGAGDVVKMSVFNNPDMTVETRVSDGGYMSVPLVGQVKVADLTVAAAEKKIAGQLESGGFVRNPQVNLLVTVLQSQQVSVLGQVNRPGRYPLDSKRSVLDTVALAGGIAADGGDTITLISKRNGENRREVIDIIDVARSGEPNRGFSLVGGDIIYVERAPRFYIYGEVQRPGTFRLERAMTVIQALSAGGGLTPRGTERGIRIKRRGTDGVLQTIDAKHDDLVKADDVIYVKESLF